MPIHQAKYPIKIRPSCIAKSTFFPSQGEAVSMPERHIRLAEERGQLPPSTSGLPTFEQRRGGDQPLATPPTAEPRHMNFTARKPYFVPRPDANANYEGGNMMLRPDHLNNGRVRPSYEQQRRGISGGLEGFVSPTTQAGMPSCEENNVVQQQHRRLYDVRVGHVTDILEPCYSGEGRSDVAHSSFEQRRGNSGEGRSDVAHSSFEQRRGNSGEGRSDVAHSSFEQRRGNSGEGRSDVAHSSFEQRRGNSGEGRSDVALSSAGMFIFGQRRGDSGEGRSDVAHSSAGLFSFGQRRGNSGGQEAFVASPATGQPNYEKRCMNVGEERSALPHSTAGLPSLEQGRMSSGDSRSVVSSLTAGKGVKGEALSWRSAKPRGIMSPPSSLANIEQISTGQERKPIWGKMSPSKAAENIAGVKQAQPAEMADHATRFSSRCARQKQPDKMGEKRLTLREKVAGVTMAQEKEMEGNASSSVAGKQAGKAGEKRLTLREKVGGVTMAQEKGMEGNASPPIAGPSNRDSWSPNVATAAEPPTQREPDNGSQSDHEPTLERGHVISPGAKDGAVETKADRIRRLTEHVPSSEAVAIKADRLRRLTEDVPSSEAVAIKADRLRLLAEDVRDFVDVDRTVKEYRAASSGLETDMLPAMLKYDEIKLPRYLSNSEEQYVKQSRHREIDADPNLRAADAEFAHNFVEYHMFAHDLNFPAYRGLRPGQLRSGGVSERQDVVRAMVAGTCSATGACVTAAPRGRAILGRGEMLSTAAKAAARLKAGVSTAEGQIAGVTVSEYILLGNTANMERWFEGSPQASVAPPPRPSPPPARSVVFSRKVFVGGLPVDLLDDDITCHFCLFGQVKVDWPHKVEYNAVFPPKGFAFLHFQEEISVSRLLNASDFRDERYFHRIALPGGGFKRVEVIPWRVSEADYCQVRREELNARTTVFVGGVPRPCSAARLAEALDSLFGCVVYAGIDTDLEFQYPKGSGRVCFSSKNCFINAISARFIELTIGNSKKRIEIKPYILDEQLCDICLGRNSQERFAAYYCPNVKCLKYHCSNCWAQIHCEPDLKFHKPLIKEARNGLHEPL